ncbi:hypothetical protein LSG31_22205 [Fodinisporobacter ferrooxydans]|uniref:Uncharacterized protein n=1 Tax=Fodinisporobacter ferrooxydans TaxID=2901836 RepID=A0ABY4CJ42_9BACL|nr:hypothetical protein LSG31_22205 [Alicyclobacillaceae bacterium MYW30-H2]
MNEQTLSTIRIGKLPAAFICLAFLNFTVGALLGVIMVLEPSAWGQYGSFHAELNPFGWLSMLIYGMTYAVLAIIAGLTLPWPVMGWLQLIVAEAGVVLILGAAQMFSGSLLRYGLEFQALSPLLFMVNILSTVFASRRKQKQVSARDRATDAAQRLANFVNHGTEISSGQMFERFFGRPDFVKATDRVAQKGTELALFCFLAAAVWALMPALHDKANGFYAMPSASVLLSYYGWIAGTVLMVSLHLYPRYAGFRVIKAWQAQIGQILWFVGLVASAFGMVGSPLIMQTGIQTIGVSFTWFALFYLAKMRHACKHTPAPSTIAWWGSWIFALILGVSLVFGLNPLSLPALHLLFLGWITSLVYGVGYTFFPIILGREPTSMRAATIQVWIALVGAVFMSGGFYLLEKDSAMQSVARVLLAVGGCLAAFSFFVFLLLWIFGNKFETHDQISRFDQYSNV